MISVPSVSRGIVLASLEIKLVIPQGGGGASNQTVWEEQGCVFREKNVPGRLGVTGSVRGTTAWKSSFDVYP